MSFEGPPFCPLSFQGGQQTRQENGNEVRVGAAKMRGQGAGSRWDCGAPRGCPVGAGRKGPEDKQVWTEWGTADPPALQPGAVLGAPSGMTKRVSSSLGRKSPGFAGGEKERG